MNPEDESRSGSSSYSLERISSPSRYWEPQNVLMEDVPEMVRAYEAQNGVQA
ncbi:hypothetical protein PC116_g10243 [Phytophthora cactorum]|uniref:Uncharacterized protein n=1 Tax=Phytophthora cactorum TaxID=29920 RepID=A0A8T1E9S5_9STRA|nr:hypothetical protein Pcac1_g12903 [Phytophthora cactorum]KAG2926125.1 hypothetical protein PC114_g3897 [Phytophthora cactorum]KAG2951326.1 hypothetical protein PC117_g3705 [Phytophthora cactorum]KAG3009428.1 hypothetical protein PC120_g15626 [Phytophthora cactorum]KAG3039906.1 hypothetical protein PC119_g1815 [Phytophthora cactorum]